MATMNSSLWKPLGLIMLLQLIQFHNAEVQQDGTCHVVSMFPFSAASVSKGASRSRLDRWTPEILAWTGFSYLAASLLAMEHFNSRNPSVVPELANLGGGGEECNVFFSTHPTVIDSRMDRTSAVQALVVLEATPEGPGIPCAVLGPPLVGSALPVQSVTAALNVPQLNYFSEADILYQQGSNSVGTANTVQGRAVVMVDYLKWILQTDSIAVLYEVAPESSFLATNLRDDTGPDSGIFVNAFLDAEPPRGVTIEEHQRQLVHQIKQSGTKTIFINIAKPQGLSSYAEKLRQAGLFSNDYVYILGPQLAPTDSMTQMYGPLDPDSALYSLLSGALVFDMMDLFRVNPDDSFLNAWRNINTTFVDRVNAVNPVPPNNTAYYHQIDTDFFQTKMPANFASYVYDAIMLIGMGACLEKSPKISRPDGAGTNIFDSNQSTTADTTTTSPNGNKPPPLRHLAKSNERKRELQGPPPSGSPMDPDTQESAADVPNPDVQAMVDSAFHGASGPVSFRRQERTRNYENMTMGLYNIRPSEIVLDSNGTRTFEAVLVSLWTKEKGWENIAGASVIYRDGTSNRPNINRDVDNNYLSPWVRGLGLALFFTATLLGLGSMMAVWILRNDASIRRSQPFFLHLLCLGSVIVSLAIVTLSFDEGSGWTDQQLDVACTMTPWFFFLGQIMVFAALFTKLWRTDKVLQFRRRAVTIKSVMGPLVVMLLTTLVILTTWTIMDPWTWERTWISVVPPETFGKCTSDHFWAFFGPLMGLLIVAEGATAFYAWKTSDVPEDFSDTGSVIQAICTQLQAWVVGVPILAVVHNSSTEATYLGRVLLIWIFAVSSVGVVVGPKIFKAIVLRRNPQLQIRKSRVKITGVSPGSSSVVSQSYVSSPSTCDAGIQSSVRKSSTQVSFCEPPEKLSLIEDFAVETWKPNDDSKAIPSPVICSRDHAAPEKLSLLDDCPGQVWKPNDDSSEAEPSQVSFSSDQERCANRLQI